MPDTHVIGIQRRSFLYVNQCKVKRPRSLIFYRQGRTRSKIDLCSRSIYLRSQRSMFYLITYVKWKIIEDGLRRDSTKLMPRRCLTFKSISMIISYFRHFKGLSIIIWVKSVCWCQWFYRKLKRYHKYWTHIVIKCKQKMLMWICSVKLKKLLEAFWNKKVFTSYYIHSHKQTHIWSFICIPFLLHTQKCQILYWVWKKSWIMRIKKCMRRPFLQMD